VITVGHGRPNDGGSGDRESDDDAHDALRAELSDAQRQVDQLREAVESRDIIATAKGLLMAQERLSSTDAFEVLRRASQRENIRVREIATRMVQAHDARAGKPA
jgi:AmiR/NasT family two-component response regulator